jgi:hypothetical protein
MIAEGSIAKVIKNTPAIEKHAKDRALERYGMDAEEFGKYVCKYSAKFKYVSITYSYQGLPGRMFIYEGKTFILRLNENVIQTTYPTEAKKETRTSALYRSRLRRKASVLFEKEIASIERIERNGLRKLEVYRAEINAEICEQRLALVNTKSFSKKLAIKGRIVALELWLQETAEDEVKIRIEKMRKLQALTEIFNGGNVG